LVQRKSARQVQACDKRQYNNNNDNNNNSRQEDPLIQIVRKHQDTINSAMLQRARRLKTDLQRGTRQIKESIVKKTKERWREERMDGQLSRRLDDKLVDIEQSYRWLKCGDI